MMDTRTNKRTDTRIVFGVQCLWWDDISKVGATPPRENGISIPCCPHCGGVLMEMPNDEAWWDSVDKYEVNGHPGYHAFIKWLRGRCFPSRAAAKAEYELGSERRVTL